MNLHDFHQNNITTDDKVDFLMIGITAGFAVISHLTAAQWSTIITIALGICGLINYGYKFFRFLKSLNK